MKMAEKLSRKSNSSGVTAILALIFHIHWERKGENLTCFSCIETSLDLPPDFCMKLTFLHMLCSGRIYAEICHHIIYFFMSICLVWNNNSEGERALNCLSCFSRAADLSVWFGLYDLSVCWRLRVLCMKIKSALWQLCPLKKTDGLLL